LIFIKKKWTVRIASQEKTGENLTGDNSFPCCTAFQRRHYFIFWWWLGFEPWTLHILCIVIPAELSSRGQRRHYLMVLFGGLALKINYPIFSIFFVLFFSNIFCTYCNSNWIISFQYSLYPYAFTLVV